MSTCWVDKGETIIPRPEYKRKSWLKYCANVERSYTWGPFYFTGKHYPESKGYECEIDGYWFAGTVGGGFFVGFIIGYAIKNVIKLAAVLVGLFIAALAYYPVRRIFNSVYNSFYLRIRRLYYGSTSNFTNCVGYWWLILYEPYAMKGSQQSHCADILSR